MKLRFERNYTRLVTIGSVEGRPEAVREFSDRNAVDKITRLPTHLVDAWIEDLKEYLGEEVESITIA